MAKENCAPHVRLMNQVLEENLREDGYWRPRLFVSGNRDVSVDDIAHDFCKMEKARKAGNGTRLAAVPF